MSDNRKISRRSALKGLAATSLTATAAGTSLLSQKARAQTVGSAKPKFLIVVGCSGGASALDAMLALKESEVKAAGGDPSTLNCFPDAMVMQKGDLRAVDVETTVNNLNQPVKGSQTPFLTKYGNEMMMVQMENTSVNHGVAQQRSVNGNDAWSGRTLMDCVAETHGKGMAIANMNMGSGGFAMPGTDTKLPEYARQIAVTSPLYFPFSLHSNKGIEEAVEVQLLAKARNLRYANLEQASNFYQTFRDSAAIKRWLSSRETTMVQYEQMDLINKLYFVESTAQGITRNPESEMLINAFPNYQFDPLEAEAILAYLAITSGVSCTVTLGPSFNAVVGKSGLGEILNPPIGFDFSHTDHRGIQAMMWTRTLSVVDRLITLLQEKDKNLASADKFWPRTLVYFATDFGRDKTRASGSTAFGTGHHLNNANLIISPMANGGKYLGGVDKKTGLTYGFDKQTGEPVPGTFMREDIVFSGILQILGVDTSVASLPDVKAMRKA